ncbi:hypothetical protein [Streptococcus sp. FT1-55]|uniref:hypothetical protein n=1 Tax=Streptococcus sp. FT1-55 TaxID=3409805 RepID=UPI003BF56B34
MAYSLDFRKKVLAYCEKTGSIEVIDKLEEVIQTLTAYQLKSIVHRDWTSAIFDFN